MQRKMAIFRPSHCPPELWQVPASSLLQRILIPNDIRGRPTGIQKIEIAVAVHVEGAQIVGLLVVVEQVDGEIPAPVVLIPFHLFALVSAGGGVEIAVAIVVGEGETVGRFDVGIDFVDFPIRRFEPERSRAVTAGSKVVDLAVTVEISWNDVRRGELVFGENGFLPRALDSVGTGTLPEGEPVSVFERLAFGSCGDLAPSVAVDVA